MTGNVRGYSNLTTALWNTNGFGTADGSLCTASCSFSTLFSFKKRLCLHEPRKVFLQGPQILFLCSIIAGVTVSCTDQVISVWTEGWQDECSKFHWLIGYILDCQPMYCPFEIKSIRASQGLQDQYLYTTELKNKLKENQNSCKLSHSRMRDNTDTLCVGTLKRVLREGKVFGMKTWPRRSSVDIQTCMRHTHNERTIHLWEHDSSQ